MMTIGYSPVIQQKAKASGVLLPSPQGLATSASLWAEAQVSRPVRDCIVCPSCALHRRVLALELLLRHRLLQFPSVGIRMFVYLPSVSLCPPIARIGCRSV